MAKAHRRKIMNNEQKTNSQPLTKIFCNPRQTTHNCSAAQIHKNTDYAIILYHEVSNFSALNTLNTKVQLHIRTETLKHCRYAIIPYYQVPNAATLTRLNTTVWLHTCTATVPGCNHTVSHKSINPTPRPYIMVMWRSVPWVMWEAVTGVEVMPYRGLLQHTLANGALV